MCLKKGVIHFLYLEKRQASFLKLLNVFVIVIFVILKYICLKMPCESFSTDLFSLTVI